MKIENVKLSDIKLNPNNPRLIKDDKFKKLVQSIIDFPEMLKIRPIVVNEDMIILGGNMRFKACKELKHKEVSIIKLSGLSAEKQREFLIKDNVSGGEWDWNLLANEWDEIELVEWGLEIWQPSQDIDYSDKNKEINVDEYDNEMLIKLKYTEDDYNLVREQLSKIAATPEQAVWKLLGNE